MFRYHMFISCLALFNFQLLTSAQTIDSCQSKCLPYNNILVSCQHDADVKSAWLSCICNDSGFSSAITPCIACQGPTGAAAARQTECKSVPPDCTVACNSFSLITQGCGSSRDCVCSGMYDTTYTTTFNQAVQNCVNCASGGGIAANWEATCCAAGKGCMGLSPQAAALMSSMKVSSTLPSTARTTTSGTTHITTAATTTISTPNEGVAAYTGIARIEFFLGLVPGLLRLLWP